MRLSLRARNWTAAWWRGEREGAPSSALGLALAPVEATFRGVVRLRNGAYDRGIFRSRSAPIPVVSVGNITVGGAGKTPFCAWLATHLVRHSPAIILRGYGADEVEVHRELNPNGLVIAAKRRLDGVREASGRGARCAILDDGFQHRRIRRDIDIVLVAAEQWGRPRRMLPRGPWREPVGSLARATHLIVTRKTAPFEAAAAVAAELALRFSITPGIVHLAPAGLVSLRSGAGGEAAPTIAGREVMGVSTLADPAPFFRHLTDLGGKVEELVFPDHHEFSDAEVEAILARAGDRPVLMTRKEAVKLRSKWPPGPIGLVLKQSVIFEQGMTEMLLALAQTVRGAR